MGDALILCYSGHVFFRVLHTLAQLLFLTKREQVNVKKLDHLKIKSLVSAENLPNLKLCPSF